MRTRTLTRAAAGLALALLATACSGGDGGGGGDGSGRPEARSTEYRTGTLRVLASSELADMAPVLDEAAKATGITVRPTYAGTLDAVERIASGEADKTPHAAIGSSGGGQLGLHWWGEGGGFVEL
ncbi:hypothetical protein ACFYUJ_38505, partial [Streptomyces sp. NPDC004520]